MSINKRIGFSFTITFLLLFLGITITENCCGSANTISHVYLENDTLVRSSVVILDKTADIKAQLCQNNTIYEISDVINLHGKEIVVPQGCSLHFMGGGFINGVIKGNNTRIVAQFGKVFGSDLELKGVFLSDEIRVSWWATLGAKDNTKEVQQALNSISAFINRCFIFDIPVRITEVSYALKYFPGTVFSGVSNSHQNNCSITVFGKKSRGIDISGTEILQFSNMLIEGDSNNPPLSLIYASRLEDNKQSDKHCFRNVSFRGEVTKAFVYNYGGEEWTLENCEFNYTGQNKLIALFYATSINKAGIESNFYKTETRITSVTYMTFNQCHFVNRSVAPSLYFESATKKRNNIYTIASLFFNQCYFNSSLGSSVRFKDVEGGISFINNVDESGATNTTERTASFYEFEGDNFIDGLVFVNNTLYVKKNTPVVHAVPSVENYFASSNKVLNNGAIWSFGDLKKGIHYGLSKNESFVITGTSKDVEIHNGEEDSSNIIIKRKNVK